MSKKHENKTNILDFAKDRAYIEAIQNNEHILDAMSYSLFSMQSLTDKNKERFSCFHGGRQQGRSFIQSMLNERREVMEELRVTMKCDKCGHLHVYNRRSALNPEKPTILCRHCGNTTFAVEIRKVEKDIRDQVSGSSSMKFDGVAESISSISDRFLGKSPMFGSLDDLKAEVNKITEKEDHLYTFNISAVELLDIHELAKDLSRENPVIIVKVRDNLSQTKILVHNSIMVKSSALKIPVPCYCHRVGLDYVLFDVKDGSSTLVNENQKHSEIISTVINWVKKVKKASVKELTTQINGKPIEIQVIKANI